MYNGATRPEPAQFLSGELFKPLSLNPTVLEIVEGFQFVLFVEEKAVVFYQQRGKLVCGGRFNLCCWVLVFGLF